MRLISVGYRNLIQGILVAAAAFTLCSCATAPAVKYNRPASGVEDVPLQVGDKIVVTLSGIPDRVDPQLIEIPADGKITVTYLTNTVQAAGLTCNELENVIHSNLTASVFASVNVKVNKMMPQLSN